MFVRDLFLAVQHSYILQIFILVLSHYIIVVSVSEMHCELQ